MRSAFGRVLLFAALGRLLGGCAPEQEAAPGPVDPFGDPITYDLGDPARAVAVVGGAGTAGPAQIALARELLDEVLLVALDDAGVPYARASIDVGDGPRDVAAIDLDGDGLEDGLSADTGSATLSIARRTADGGFGAVESVAVDAAPSRVCVADLTGDAVPEIVVSSGVGDAAGVRIWTPAPGGVVPVGALVALPGASRIVAGDVDADGDADVVAVLDGDRVAVALNDGSGALTPQELAACESPVSAALGDLDGDELTDLVIACAGGAVVVFGPVGEASRRQSLGPAAQLYDVVARDLDGDGRVDVVAVDVIAHEALIWLAPAAGGSAEPLRKAVTRGPVAATTADVDGDGRLDLVVLGYEERQLQVLLGKP